MSDDRSGDRVGAGGDDDRSLRDHGRHLAMDSLLAMALAGSGGPLALPPRRMPAWAVPAALAATVAVAITGYLAVRPADGPADGSPAIAGVDPVPASAPLPSPTPVALATGWRITPTGAAAFRALGSDTIRLERGELHVESTGAGPAAEPLTIETPAGRATARGTSFYVGCHADAADRDDQNLGATKERPMKTTLLTRVLVLAGMVTLTNAHGETTGGPDDLLVATEDSAPVRDAVTANGDFAFDLYGQLAGENPGKNLFFSPYSLASALAMTAEGARGETAAEMGKVLRYPEAARRIGADAQLLPWNTSLIHTGMAALNDRFQSKADAPYEISVANALYGEKTCPFSPDYAATIAKFYGTGVVRPVDFKNAAEAARREINAWAEMQTRGRIKDLVPPLGVDSMTRLVLLNAIYFKGDWSEPFDARATAEEDFHSAAGKSRVAMMNATLKGGRYAAFTADGQPFKTPQTISLDEPAVARYPGSGGFQIAELPYEGNELSMVLVVPLDADGLAGIEKRLTAARLQDWLGTLEDREMRVAMPRFRIETSCRMKEPLEALGMRRAFAAEAATFNGMAAPGAERLSITQVFHKAFVEVTEQGTEAAAATAVEVLSQGIEQAFTPAVRADRPFVFAIRDVRTGTVLFLGRLSDPAGVAVPAE